jgi:hypothetical protein
MSAATETIAAIQALMQQLHAATTTADAAVGQAEQARQLAGALGDARSVAAFAQVHELLAEARQALQPVVERADQAMSRVKAIEGG